MNKMNAPEMEVVRFENEDVLTASIYNMPGSVMHHIYMNGDPKTWLEDPKHNLHITGHVTAGAGNTYSGTYDFIRTGYRTYEVVECTGDHEHKDTFGSTSVNNSAPILEWLKGIDAGQ